MEHILAHFWLIICTFCDVGLLNKVRVDFGHVGNLGIVVLQLCH